MTKTIAVSNMTCGHCKMAVEKALTTLEAVQSAEVDLIEGTAEVELVIDIDNEVIKNVIKSAGYEVTAIS